MRLAILGKIAKPNENINKLLHTLDMKFSPYLYNDPLGGPTPI